MRLQAAGADPAYFFDALIVETVIPALDGRIEEPAYIKEVLPRPFDRESDGKIEGGRNRNVRGSSFLDIAGLDCKRSAGSTPSR